MVCLCWLLVVVMAYVWVPGLDAACWDNSICKDLSNKDSVLDCLHLCTSQVQTELPEVSESAIKVNKDGGDDEGLLLNLILSTLDSKDKISDVETNGDHRRSYSMEHFRWGKPSGRKRRPVKVFASSLEGGGSSEGSFLPQARRQLSSIEDGGRVSTKLSPQERKDGTYRMSHFRWGSPPASKRSGGHMKTWEEKPQGQLEKLFRNIIVKDVQRIMG